MTNFSYLKLTKAKKIRYLKLIRKNSIYIVFLVLFYRLCCIPVDNLCCTTFVFDSYDDAHGDGRGFDGQKLVR